MESSRHTRPGSRIELRFSFRTQRDGVSVERGREWAAYDFNEDQTITLRAMSSSDDPRVTRDAIYTLDAGYRPLECFFRVQVDGRHEGSGWFRFDDGVAIADTRNVRLGPAHQELPIDGRAGGFNTHPVVTDALLCAAYDRGNPARRQRLGNLFSSSTDPYGRTGPTLVPMAIDIEWFGTASVETPVGAVDADHYALYPRATDREPLEEIWCLAGTCLLVRARAASVYGTEYVLTEWRGTP